MFSAIGQGLLLKENKGQFNSNILYKADLNFGALFVENARLTFVLHHKGQLEYLVEAIHHKELPIPNLKFNSHAFSIEFEGANKNATYTGNNKTSSYYNYFQGNDPSKWAGQVYGYGELYIKNLYPNIDFRLFGKAESLKYEFIVHPGANPALIKMKYDGATLKHLDNKIEIETSVGKLTDEKPISFYKSNKHNTINTSYILNNNTISFQLGKYDTTQPFILDPELRFASFTGATIDNWGFTATYDASGNAYAGGIAFGTGYPVTIGAFQSTFGGPSGDYKTDISISKFNENGDQLIYSTYLGGNGIECPHSLVVTDVGELVVFGTTSSTNFPTSATAFDKTYNGGSQVLVDNVLDFSGSDIIVTKFNSSGTGLVGSTYYGGSANDGFNDESYSVGLYHNYSDVFRGEVISDATGNVFIATTTASKDIPMQNGFQTTHGGGTYDGIVIKFNNDLSSLVWSSYIGGTDDDAAYGIQPQSNGDVYVTGGTKSANFPIVGNAHQGTYNGNIDGFIGKIAQNGASLLHSTYVGTNDYDQSYFVQVDEDDKVYVYGQTEGTMTISNGVYNNPNSGQFIRKYSADLSTLEKSTQVGKKSGSTELVPSAFLVNTCGQIYIAGWGGVVNAKYGGGTTDGFPLTKDAFQPSTDGNDFYLMLLEKDMAGLKYATYFGGNGAREHVDGGTSRFDKKGVVYQSVCAGCGAISIFPVTTGAWSETNNSQNCNLGIFKFDVSKLTSVIAVSTDTLVCAKDTIRFNNGSNGGTSYKWIFHDGVTSTDKNTWRIIEKPGTYEVMLVAHDPSACPAYDTTTSQFTVLALPDINVESSNIESCFGDSVTMKATGADEYLWFNTNFSQIDPTGEIKVSPEKLDTFYVTANNSFCRSDTEMVVVDIFYPPKDTAINYTRCDYEDAKLPLQFQKDYKYTWTPSEGITMANDSVSINPSTPTNYTLTIEGKCGTSTVNYNIDVITINALAGPDTIVCPNDSFNLFAYGGDSYKWFPSDQVLDSTNQFPKITSSETTDYTVLISKGKCSKIDTASVKVYEKPYQEVKDDYTIQYGESVSIDLNPAFSYDWKPRKFLDCDDCSSITSTPDEDIMYYFTYNDDNSCLRTDSIEINVIFNLYIANTFTPNGDGKNDIFFAYSWLLKDFQMDIYNRWGEKIFTSHDVNHGWDGTVNGRLAQIDVYVYKITYTKVHTNKPITFVGHVNLIR